MIFRLETSTEKSKYFRLILNLNIFLHLYTELFVSRRIIKFKNNHDRPVLFPLQTHGCAIYTLSRFDKRRKKSFNGEDNSCPNTCKLSYNID